MLCTYCGRFCDALLCPACSKELREQSYALRYNQRCPTCGRPLLDRAYPCPFCKDGIEAYSSYTALVGSLLRQYKLGQEKVLAKVLAPLYSPMLIAIEKPLLLPVPASRKGLESRGFDQMLLICKILTKRTGYPSLRLFAQKGEGQSKFLSLSERKDRHTLSLRPLSEKVIRYREAGYTFVLLDDICTSGVTLRSCSSLLAEAYGIKALSLVIAMV